MGVNEVFKAMMKLYEILLDGVCSQHIGASSAEYGKLTILGVSIDIHDIIQ
jgi:hypothetical protein